MDEINWTAPGGTTKRSLEGGIRSWVKQKTGLEFVPMPSLYRLNSDEMMMMAMAMGYEPSKAERERVEWDQIYARRHAESLKIIHERTPAQMPHPFRTVEGGTFCATCGMIKAARLHDPVVSEIGIDVPHPLDGGPF